MPKHLFKYLPKITTILSFSTAFNWVHDCFVAAAEWHIQVADAINFKIISKNGIEEKDDAIKERLNNCSAG